MGVGSGPAFWVAPRRGRGGTSSHKVIQHADKIHEYQSDPDAGAVLQQMNAVAPRIYEQEAFRQVVHVRYRITRY
jgi:hypothetical protein